MRVSLVSLACNSTSSVELAKQLKSAIVSVGIPIVHKGVVVLELDDATRTLVRVENPRFKCVKPAEMKIPVYIRHKDVYIEFEGTQSDGGGKSNNVNSRLHKGYILNILNVLENHHPKIKRLKNKD